MNNKAHYLPWCDREYKRVVRKQTIFDQYTTIFNNDRIEGQYWSLCGDCCDENGDPSDWSDVGQAVKLGLINQTQFYGVDNSQRIINRNRQAYPDANWICGDFVSTVCRNKNFRNHATLVNIDTQSEPPNAISMLADVLVTLCSDNPRKVMVALNMIVKNPHRPSNTFNINDIIKIMEDHPLIQLAMRKGWKMLPSSAQYDTNSHSSMHTIWWTLY